MSVRQASVNQNIVLTRVVQGIKSQKSKMVGQFLSPKVPVPSRTGQIVKFDNSNTVIYDTRRAPGAETKRRLIGYAGDPYILHQDSLEGELPREIVQESQIAEAYGRGAGGSDRPVPFNLEKRIVEGTMESLDLRLEYDIANKLTNPANYNSANVVTLAGAEVLNDPNSDILGLFDDARERVADTTLEELNSAIFSRKAFNAAINHPQIRAYFSGVSSELVAEAQLARILRLERGIKVARAKKLRDGTDADFENIWGNAIIAGYVPDEIDQDKLEPAFSYTYQLLAHPYVEDPYYDRNRKTTYYPVTDECETYITNKDAGFLILNATSN
jgi:hypothetical protein